MKNPKKVKYLLLILMLLPIPGEAARRGERVWPRNLLAILQEPKPADLPQLVPGPRLERKIAGGESHSYRVLLASGQYLKVTVSQKEIDVVMAVFSPDGKKITEVDNSGGPETVFLVAEVSGDYRVEIRTADKEAKAGAYEIGVLELREASATDRTAVAAEKIFEEGNRLRDERTPEARRKALEKYKESLPLWREARNPTGEAQTFNEMGVLHSNLGDPAKAVEHYEQAVVLARSAGDPFIEANTLTNMGTTYWRLGESEKSLARHTLALSLAKAAGDFQNESLILSNIGAVYWSLGQPHDSLKYYDQALLMSRARGNRRQQAITLNNIAASYQQLGDLEKALEALTEVIALRRALGDRQGEAAPLNNLGLLHTQLGDLPKALDYYKQALELKQASGDKQGQATNLQGLSGTYSRMGELAQALKYAEDALGLARAVADPRLEAYVLDTFGKIYRLSGEPAKALENFELSLSLRRKVGDRYGETYALSNIGNSYLEVGNSAKALEYYRQSLELSKQIGDRLGSAAVLYGLARTHNKMGDNVSALAAIEEALAIVESTRIKVPSQDFRSSFLASYRDYFQFYTNLLMQMHQDQPSAGNDVKAFAASERGRARSLLELLTEARIDVGQSIAPDLKQRETNLQAKISWVQSQLIQANSRPKPDAGRIASLEQEFKRIENDRALLAIEIRQKHPRYANLQYPSPLALKAVQQSLDEKTVLLEYSLGSDASFLFAITRNDFVSARLPAAAVLTKQVADLREAVAARPDRMRLSNYLQKARSLYQDLVQPANRLLSGKQSLIIVPDGIVHYLPFEVLLRSDSGRRAQLDLRQLPYLVRDFSISYAPSATVLGGLQSADPSTPSRRKTFLAYGDPSYGMSESQPTAPVPTAFRSAFGDGKPWELQPLPESRNEVERIAKLFPASQARVFLGEQANEQNVKADDGRDHYRFVHFAVHGLLNENKPQYSGLVLSLPRPEKERSGVVTAGGSNGSSLTNRAPAEDGLLQVYEIFNLKLNAELVVLSACETGLGKETRGEGLVGLTQAFFYAGTSSLMVSLWKVQDKSTAELMVGFYRHLNNPGLNKAQALRQAQLEMIRKVNFAHPYYWAGFVLTGKS